MECRLGRKQVATVALEELKPHLSFERLQLMADRRLRHLSASGHRRHRGPLHQRDERPKKLQIHRSSSLNVLDASSQRMEHGPTLRVSTDETFRLERRADLDDAYCCEPLGAGVF